MTDHNEPQIEQPEMMKGLEEVAYLALYHSIPIMDEMNAGEMTCKVTLTAKDGRRYRSTIHVCELDENDQPNV